jgi:aminoglycoside phosphotransferase (APT) family kinase protein
MPTDGADSAGTAEFLSTLARMGLLTPGETPPITPLTGGVSSDIVRVDLVAGPVCIKRALSRLKVKADWRAPVERNRWEVEWMRKAASIVPAAVPRVLGEDADAGMFVMEYLAPAQHPVWKDQLRDGVIDPAFAAEVGRRIALIHAHTARRDDVAAVFATDHIFFPIRLEPYLAAAARIHTDCAAQLQALIDVTSRTKLALVHGDVSPKNILCGPHGPVFLDAECAWYGDPAFDLAFCLNHTLLKCTWRPHWAHGYLACFDALSRAYLETADWEPVARLEARTARLLPGLLLARVDGKSPVEYITGDWQRTCVRKVATSLLRKPVAALSEVRAMWERELRASAPDDLTQPLIPGS